MNIKHINSSDCPACTSTLTLVDLPIGTRVRVSHRNGAEGVVTGQVTAARNLGMGGVDMVEINFGRSRHGWNLPRQCEVI